MPAIAILTLVLLSAGDARAEHGMPGDFLDEHYRIPQYGYLILEGKNGITDDMWHLVKRPRRLVSVSAAGRHIVPLRLIAAYDREVPDFRGAGGYGENCVVLQPTRRMKPGRTYQLEVRVAKPGKHKRTTWQRIKRSEISLATKATVPSIKLVTATIGAQSATDKSPLVTVRINGGAGKRLWLASRVTTHKPKRTPKVRTHWRHFATTARPSVPSWLGECVFHPIATGTTHVSMRFRVSDQRRGHTRWSKPIVAPAHGQLTVCVIRSGSP